MTLNLSVSACTTNPGPTYFNIEKLATRSYQKSLSSVGVGFRNVRYCLSIFVSLPKRPEASIRISLLGSFETLSLLLSAE
ncbi:hypothetical protein K0M31_010787 [Melipona bicolor]|uniref:Uncharacterized protein n=1 Tax=Melipona bicolor TaxID=60889 RepID=A0AA40FLH5_9HYME|nr:hypothetical protein K0M31_010787 [Melipona bicolor]